MHVPAFRRRHVFVKVAPGATVTVELKNEGKAQHTFTVDGGVDQQLAPGAKATVTVTAPKSGSLQFHCDFHGAMGMTDECDVGLYARKILAVHNDWGSAAAHRQRFAALEQARHD